MSNLDKEKQSKYTDKDPYKLLHMCLEKQHSVIDNKLPVILYNRETRKWEIECDQPVQLSLFDKTQEFFCMRIPS